MSTLTIEKSLNSVTFFLGVTCKTDVILDSHFINYKWVELEDIDNMDLFEQYRQLLIKINLLIHKNFLLVSSDNINIENLDSYQGIGSKHA